ASYLPPRLKKEPSYRQMLVRWKGAARCPLWVKKRTFAVHQLMSALHPIATAKAKSRKRPCLLYPRKRICAVHSPMSALGQKRTWSALFDHLISAGEQRRRYGEVQRFGRFQIDDQIDFCGLLDR